MLEALAIQHYPMSEWGGFMLEAMAIQHYPVLEWEVLCWRHWQFSIVRMGWFYAGGNSNSALSIVGMGRYYAGWSCVRSVNCVFCYSMRW